MYIIIPKPVAYEQFVKKYFQNLEMFSRLDPEVGTYVHKIHTMEGHAYYKSKSHISVSLPNIKLSQMRNV